MAWSFQPVLGLPAIVVGRDADEGFSLTTGRYQVELHMLAALVHARSYRKERGLLDELVASAKSLRRIIGRQGEFSGNRSSHYFSLRDSVVKV